ncbi:hypothetical protein NDU88_001646 [Pleurodeles waltl]|uniref:Uncharacterized protein n=1 Tax=Pleurodeles waltl TaxID=8319 RepID=A0AAV7KT69_PLEWA|nr:hypothetical protein NDU88_001646 [Pleurodeles waltl]
MGPQPSRPTVVPAGPRVVRLLLLVRQLAPSWLRGHAVCTVLNYPTGAPAVCPPTCPSTIQGRAGSRSQQYVLFPWGAAPSGAPQFSPGPSISSGPGGGPATLTALHRVQSLGPRVSPAWRPARSLPLGSGRQSRPSHSTMGLSPSGASWSPPDFSAPRGTGCGPAPLVPPPGGNSRAPASLLQGGPFGASLQSLAVRPRPAAAHGLMGGPGSRSRDGQPASPAVDSRVSAATHFGARAGARPLPGSAPSSSPSLGH